MNFFIVARVFMQRRQKEAKERGKNPELRMLGREGLLPFIN